MEFLEMCLCHNANVTKSYVKIIGLRKGLLKLRSACCLVSNRMRDFNCNQFTPDSGLNIRLPKYFSKVINDLLRNCIRILLPMHDFI